MVLLPSVLGSAGSSKFGGKIFGRKGLTFRD
jgi:hypothetical protein